MLWSFLASHIPRSKQVTHHRQGKLATLAVPASHLTRKRRPLFPGSSDGMFDKSVINLNTDRPDSCWTPPISTPPASDPIKGGTCNVCVVQRHNGDGSGDYLLWARDSDNNAMGNMDQTNVWPIDGMTSSSDISSASMPMSDGLTLLLQPSLSVVSPHTDSQMDLLWVMPPHDPTNASIWSDTSDPQMPQGQFDPGAKGTTGTNCNFAGSVPGSSVVYVQCAFSC